MSGVEGLLHGTLERSRELGFLGPGPVAAHIAHATAFGRAVEQFFGAIPGSVADLGSGGGVPALVLAARWHDTRVVLIETMKRRARFLRDAIVGFEWGDRVLVVEARAEDAAHDPELREAFDVITARSFAGPAATAEIAAGFLRVGGVLAVSEPPVSPDDRWPPDPLHHLGFGPAEIVSDRHGPAHFALIRKTRAADPLTPRRRSMPVRRPRW